MQFYDIRVIQQLHDLDFALNALGLIVDIVDQAPIDDLDRKLRKNAHVHERIETTTKQTPHMHTHTHTITTNDPEPTQQQSAPTFLPVKMSVASLTLLNEPAVRARRGVSAISRRALRCAVRCGASQTFTESAPNLVLCFAARARRAVVRNAAAPKKKKKEKNNMHRAHTRAAPPRAPPAARSLACAASPGRCELAFSLALCKFRSVQRRRSRSCEGRCRRVQCVAAHRIIRRAPEKVGAVASIGGRGRSNKPDERGEFVSSAHKKVGARPYAETRATLQPSRVVYNKVYMSA